jgi:hypothetical protein
VDSASADAKNARRTILAVMASAAPPSGRNDRALNTRACHHLTSKPSAMSREAQRIGRMKQSLRELICGGYGALI